MYRVGVCLCAVLVLLCHLTHSVPLQKARSQKEQLIQLLKEVISEEKRGSDSRSANRFSRNGQGCETVSSGVELKSPGYPGFYPAGTEKCYIITVDEGQFIRLTFLALNLGPACEDYIVIHDGGPSSPELANICATPVNASHTFVSTSNTMYINFSGVLGSGTGFWAAVSATDGVDPCGPNKPETLYPPGFVVNPEYKHGLDCEWRIVDEDDEIIDMNVESLRLEYSYGCTRDHVEILESGSRRAIFCGDVPPGDVVSSQNEVNVRFQADASQGDNPTMGVVMKFNKESRIRGGSGGTYECGLQAIEPQLPVEFMRIVGGDEAVPNSWPWQISLQRMQHGYFSHWCGASILSPRWILTATHCTFNREAADFRIVAGEHQRSNVIGQEGEVAINVARIIQHQFYSQFTLDNDIALLELEQELVYNDQISPICLPDSDFLPPTMCIVTGWGETQGTADNDVLQQLEVPLIDTGDCNSREWYRGAISNQMMCAGYEQGEQDSCQGDSGGPLVCRKQNGRWVQVGIVSWGDRCAQERKPGVYAKVSRFIDWIYENTGHEVVVPEEN